MANLVPRKLSCWARMETHCPFTPGHRIWRKNEKATSSLQTLLVYGIMLRAGRESRSNCKTASHKMRRWMSSGSISESLMVMVELKCQNWQQRICIETFWHSFGRKLCNQHQGMRSWKWLCEKLSPTPTRRSCRCQRGRSLILPVRLLSAQFCTEIPNLELLWDWCCFGNLMSVSLYGWCSKVLHVITCF